VSKFSESAGVEFLGVSVDAEEATRVYAAAHELSFPIVVLPGDREIRVLRGQGVPQTVVVNGDGEVVYAYRGSLSRNRSELELLTVVLEDAVVNSKRRSEASRASN
jgi:peroxiredoxin